MKVIMKKIVRMIVASIIILFVGVVISLILNIIEHCAPILFWIMGVVILLFTGYIFGNKFE